MGFYYRKTISVGPFRVNVGKSGVGYSIGTPGFRTGVSSRGRSYTRVSIPGTGMGYQTGGRGCLFVLLAIPALGAAIVGLVRGVLG